MILVKKVSLPVIGFQGLVVGCSVAVWYQYGSRGGEGRTGGIGTPVGNDGGA